MAAISYEQIRVEGPWELQSVYELSIHSGLNRHTIARFTALVTEKSGAEAGLKETVDDRVKIYIDDNGKKTMLFQGRIKEVDIRLRTGVYLLSAGLISETSLLDREIKSRSFQNTELTYDQVVGKVLQDYPGKSLELTAAKVKLTGPVIQYLETDWQFILRMASLQETVIAADGTAIQRIFAYGYPSGQEKTLPDEISYSFTKDIRAYERDAEYNPHCNSAEYAYYEVESYDPLTIGDPVTFQGYPMYVGEVTVQLQQGLLVYMAKLVRKATLRQNPIYNKAFQGTSLIGKVLQLQSLLVSLCSADYRYDVPHAPIGNGRQPVHTENQRTGCHHHRLRAHQWRNLPENRRSQYPLPGHGIRTGIENGTRRYLYHGRQHTANHYLR
jgi:hypothetical protein